MDKTFSVEHTGAQWRALSMVAPDDKFRETLQNVAVFSGYTVATDGRTAVLVRNDYKGPSFLVHKKLITAAKPGKKAKFRATAWVEDGIMTDFVKVLFEQVSPTHKSLSMTFGTTYTVDANYPDVIKVVTPQKVPALHEFTTMASSRISMLGKIAELFPHKNVDMSLAVDDAAHIHIHEEDVFVVSMPMSADRSRRVVLPNWIPSEPSTDGELGRKR